MANKFFKNTKLYWALGLVIVILAAGFWFNDHRRLTATHVPSTKRPTTSATTTKGTTDKTTDQPAVSSGSDKTTSGSSPSNSSTTAALLSPYGNFVSNHHPGQNGTPTTEVSVCNTTPGATCYIQFTMGSTRKTLDTETADSSGSATWYWDVGDAGFSQGSWQVSAVASLAGQSKTTQDSITLDMQP